MRTRTRPCCNRQTFVTESEARRRLDRIVSLGVSRVLPMEVEKCRNGWHLKFPNSDSGLAAVSKKRQKENAERREMVRTLWPDETPRCIVKGCPRLADDVHEPLSRGRGGLIQDPDNAVPICRPHHDEVTFGEPEWAYEQGLLIHSWDGDTVAEVAERRALIAWETLTSPDLNPLKGGPP